MPYSGDPSSSPVDAVRFWAQDVGDPPLLSDAEIAYLIEFSEIDATVSPVQVAAIAADMIATKYAGFVSINADGVNYSGDQLYNRYTQLAAQLRKTEKTLQLSGALPYFGGIIRGDGPDPTVRDPQFGIGMDDNPEGASQEYGYLGEGYTHQPTGTVP